MLATRMLYKTPYNPPGIYVPLGAEGYDANGNVVVPVFEEGWLYGEAGQVVFKGSTTTRDFGTLTHTLTDLVAEVLVVAPGGGGGGGANAVNRGAGGGGAGGVIYNNSFTIPSSLAAVIQTPGTGGAIENNGVSGGSSQFGSLIATGGGYGARAAQATAVNAGNGGSGGGGGDSSGGISYGGTGVAGQGNYGANRQSSLGAGGGGSGGGGAGSPGNTCITYTGANGGDPATYFGFPYARGGRGGDYNTAGVSGVEGRPHTGDGGGGGKRGDSGKAGGHGIIILRWGGYNKNYVHLFGGSVEITSSASNGGVCNATTTFPAVNATGLTRSNGRLIIDLKCDNPSYLTTNSQLEITSSGVGDIEEWTFNNVQSLGITSSWQTFSIPLSAFQEYGDPVDVTNINYIRWYNFVSAGAPTTTIFWRNAYITYG